MAIVLNDAGNYWADSIGSGFNSGMDKGLTAYLQEELDKKRSGRSLENQIALNQSINDINKENVNHERALIQQAFDAMGGGGGGSMQLPGGYSNFMAQNGQQGGGGLLSNIAAEQGVSPSNQGGFLQSLLADPKSLNFSSPSGGAMVAGIPSRGLLRWR